MTSPGLEKALMAMKEGRLCFGIPCRGVVELTCDLCPAQNMRTESEREEMLNRLLDEYAREISQEHQNNIKQIASRLVRENMR
jgi:hypothetical protein